MTLVETETRSQFDRLPPHSLDAEAALIGSAFLAGNDAKAFARLRPLVSPADFYHQDNRIVWTVLCEMHDAGRAVDALTVREELRSRGLYAEVGGAEYLARVLNAVPTHVHGEHYASLVRGHAGRRELISLANDLVRASYSPSCGAEGAAEIARRSMARLAAVAQSRAGNARRLDDLLAEVRAQMAGGGTPLVPTGFRDLDALSGGVGLGEMVLVGARPSMGKSTIVKQMALRAARSGVPSAVISLEEGGAKIARNLLAAESMVDNNKIRRARLSEQEWHEVDEGVGRLAGVEFYVVDRVRRLADVEAEAALLAGRYGVQFLAIDYLQRVHAGGQGAYDRASLASLGISDLVKDLHVAGVVPVQLNRAVEGRDDKRPTMADLRDSGQIEQDADGIVFLHREDYYHASEADYEPTGVAELIVAKWRDGVRGKTVRLRSNLRYQTFEDLGPAPGPAREEEDANCPF